MKNKVYFRVDGNQNIGFGHVSRCISVAQILKGECRGTFLLKNSEEFVFDQLKEEGFDFELVPSDLNGVSEAAYMREKISDNNILVLDGYEFDSEYQSEIKKNKKSILVCIDDLHCIHFFSDVVINHADAAKADDYSAEPYTKLYLGFDYIMLRKPFLERAALKRDVNNVDKAFICFGGADLHNISQKAAEACLLCHEVKEINVVVSENFKYIDALLELRFKSNKPFHVHQNLNAHQMIGLMEKCTLAVCPASTIAFEVCSVKSGFISGYTADNQSLIHQSLLNKKCCESIGDFRKASISELADKIKNHNFKKVVKNQNKVFNGDSSGNILKIFNNLC